MLILITGGSGSGKSCYGEQLLAEMTGLEKKYYLATMEVFDEEGHQKVERHKVLREGKGFITIEQPRDIHQVLEHMSGAKTGALLECMSNLTANEMFGGERKLPTELVEEKIIKGIQSLSGKLDCLIVMTNNVFEDGNLYDASTMEYILTLGNINKALAEMADVVTEVVVGIPITAKGEKSCQY